MCSCKISILFLWKKILIYNYESMIRRSWPRYHIEKFKQYFFKWHFIYLKLQIDQQNLKYSYTKGITKMDKTFTIKYVITVHMPNWCHVPNSSHARSKVCKISIRAWSKEWKFKVGVFISPTYHFTRSLGFLGTPTKARFTHYSKKNSSIPSSNWHAFFTKLT